MNDGKSTLGLNGRMSGFDMGRPRWTTFVLFCWSVVRFSNVFSSVFSLVESMLRRLRAASTVNSAIFGIWKQTSVQLNSVPFWCFALKLLISLLICANWNSKPKWEKKSLLKQVRLLWAWPKTRERDPCLHRASAIHIYLSRFNGMLTFLRIRGSSTSGAVIKTLCVRVPSSNDFISHSVSRRNFESVEAKENDRNSAFVLQMNFTFFFFYLEESIVSVDSSPCGIWHSLQQISASPLSSGLLFWMDATLLGILIYK